MNPITRATKFSGASTYGSASTEPSQIDEEDLTMI